MKKSKSFRELFHLFSFMQKTHLNKLKLLSQRNMQKVNGVILKRLKKYSFLSDHNDTLFTPNNMSGNLDLCIPH